MSRRKIAVALGVAVLAVPGAAAAKPGTMGVTKQEKKASKGPKPKKVKSVMYVFKGVYQGAGVVTVAKGNAHVRKGGYVGDDVTFDFAKAKLVVAETDGVAGVTAADLRVGDALLVQARLPRGTKAPEPAAAGTGSEATPAAAIVARKVVDKTHPPVEDADEAPEAPEAPESAPVS